MQGPADLGWLPFAAQGCITTNLEKDKVVKLINPVDRSSPPARRKVLEMRMALGLAGGPELCYSAIQCGKSVPLCKLLSYCCFPGLAHYIRVFFLKEGKGRVLTN